MKKVYSLFILFILASPLAAQKTLTGSYSFSSVWESDGGKTDTLPAGRLYLIKMEGTTYRFWLDLQAGPPGYNRGETDGTITIINDSASFDNTFEDATAPCMLNFKVGLKNIQITGPSSSFNCGFGNAVNADGIYAWLPQQETLNNDWLKKQYPQAPFLTVAAAKAQLYKDEDGLRSFTEKQFLSKDDQIINIIETEKTVYTEMIRPDHSLLYGWIRKSDLKMTD